MHLCNYYDPKGKDTDLGTQDAWSWDQNPPNFTLDLVSYNSANKRTTSRPPASYHENYPS